MRERQSSGKDEAAIEIVGALNLASGATGFGGGLGLIAVVLLFHAGAGFVGGTLFSMILGLMDGDRRFDPLSLPRFALWGAIGGGLLSALWGGVAYAVAGSLPISGLVILGVTVALLGAGSAAGSLALARKAEDEELLTAAEAVADVGLTTREAREFLAP